MGDLIPFPKRVSGQQQRAQYQTGRLSNLKPETLTRILNDTERGRITDFAILCDRMVRFDGVIRANYVTRLAAIAGARYEIIPGRTGDPKRDQYAQGAADFVEDRLRELDVESSGDETSTLARTDMELLDAIGVGVSVDEIDWRWVEGKWWAIEAFRFVHQRALEYGPTLDLRITDLGDNKRIPGGTPLSTWPRKFVIHQPRELATDQSCAGVLQSVAWLYLFKRWCMQFWVHGAERFAWPMIWGKVASTADQAARDKLMTVLERFTAEQRAVTNKENEIEILETTVKDAGTWKNLRAALNEEIGQALLGSADQTQASEIGAWKAVESRKNTTVDSRMALDEVQYAASFQRGVIKPLLEFNTHLWNGVLPPIPIRRFVIAEKRREIPAHLLPYKIVTKNEARVSIGLDPWKDDRGEELLGAPDAPAEPAPAPVG